MSDLEQRIKQTVVMEIMSRTLQTFDGKTVHGDVIKAVNEAPIQVYLDMYAAAKVGELLEEAKQLKRVLAHIEGTKRVETPYVTIKDIDEIAARYGVNREERDGKQ